MMASIESNVGHFAVKKTYLLFYIDAMSADWSKVTKFDSSDGLETLGL